MSVKPDVEIRIVHRGHEFSLYSFTGLLLVFSFFLIVAIEISIGYQYWFSTDKITYWFQPDYDVLMGANTIFSWAEDQSAACTLSVIADPENESRKLLNVSREFSAGYAGIGKEFPPSFQLKKTDVLEFSVRNLGPPSTFVIQFTEKKDEQDRGEIWEKVIHLRNNHWNDISIPIPAFELNKSYGIQDNYELDLDKLDSMLFVLSANEKHDLLFTPILFHTKVFPAIYVVFLILNLIWFTLLFYYGISQDIRFTSTRFWAEWTKFCIYQFLIFHYFETLLKNPFFLYIFLFLLLETIIHLVKKSTQGISLALILASPFMFSLALISNNLALAWFPIVFAAHSLHTISQYKTKGAFLSLLSLAAFALFSLYYADAHPDMVSVLISILIVCLYRVIVFSQDHYKQIEEQGQEILKEKQQMLLYYQTAIETSVDGFAIFEIQEEHPEKRFICRHTNRAVAKLLHKDIAEILGQPVDALFPDIYQIEQTCRTVYHTGEPEIMNNVELNINDVQLVYHFSLSKISNAIAMFIQNNTREYVLEKQIRHSQKMEAIGHLSGGIAHNINNLLTGILGNLAIAKRKDAASSSEYLKKAEDAANRAADLVKKLTAFSRKSAILAKPASPNFILDDVYNIINVVYDPGIQIRIHQEDHLPTIDADSFQINSVLMNLCGNARDAVQERLLETSSLTYLPTITLESACVTFSPEETASMPQSYPGTFVRFCVRDNGVGMDENTQKHIFEPFFTTKAILGTGLDLASAFGIIKQHQGWIAFESVKGKGSQFAIYIPVSKKTQNPTPRT